MARGLLVLMAVMVAAAGAWAGPVDPTDPYETFSKGTLRQALDESKAHHRMLIVYVRGDPKQSPDTKRMDEVTWTNPVVAAWIKWHGVAYRMDYRDNPGLMGKLRVSPASLPTTIFFIEGVEFARLPRGATNLPIISMEDPLHGAITGYQGPAYFTFFMDFTLQRAKATDPIFGAFHEESNPPPPPPPPGDPFHTIDDGLAPTVVDPIGPDGIDVLEMLAEARSAVEKGDLYRATGLYTWLWERAAAVDPAFRAVRRGVIADEMRRLARDRDGARERFTAMRDEFGKRLLWADFDDIFEWFVMNEIIGEDVESLRKLDFEMNDPQMATMMPQADLLAYRIMTSREHFADPAEIGDDPVARVRRLAELARARPRNVYPDDWPGFKAFVQVHLLDEACRLHAACLARGRVEEAMAVADVLLAARDDALSRRALVATALASGQAHPRHAEWLRRAAELGKPSPLLSRWLSRQLDPS